MKTILVVDDSAPIRYLLEAILGQKYKVCTSPDGITALRWLSRGNVPDLIISDVQMPNMDGLEMSRNLYSNLLYRDIPVILLTGMQLSEDMVPDLNIVQIVNKPFDPAALLEVVERQLTTRASAIVAG